MIYDRAAGRLIDAPSYGSQWLHFFYETIPGRMLLRVLVSKTVARWHAAYNRTGYSARKIPGFIERYAVNPDDLETKQFSSFSDFFDRRLKVGSRPFSKPKRDVIAVADGKLSAYTISNSLILHIKHSTYTVSEIIQDVGLAKRYSGGTCLVLRMTVDDCHRYLFPDDGAVEWSKMIPGVLHTVQPIGQASRPYARNSRVITSLATANFGDVIVCEIGALLVGAIRNEPVDSFTRGQEKGHFEMGGSTILLLYQPGIMKLDRDIAEYAARGIEVAVKSGERIGSLNA